MRLTTSNGAFVLLLLLITLPVTVSAAKIDAECNEIDLQAIKLAADQKLEAAAAMYERASIKCPPDPSRMTSQGVLQALLGDRDKAESLIHEAIDLAERQGDHCRADLSRGELEVIRGGAKSPNVPASCEDQRRAAVRR